MRLITPLIEVYLISRLCQGHKILSFISKVQGGKT